MARKILLADDSVTAQNMGRKILADAGYEVVTVNNGSAALKKIAELKPDLVILDVYMPGYSGLEVCQRLKESQDSSRIPVLLTVGKLEPFKPEEAQRVRAEGFIVKPFEASELLSALSKLEDKVVPRAEPSKPGRFARAIAAQEESGRGVGGNESASQDSGWKNRIGFPHKKAEPEEKVVEDDSIYNPVNRDLRTVVETAAEKRDEERQLAEKAREASVDVAAVAPAGLPSDVTPEELAAIAAAAAQLHAVKDEYQVPEPPVSPSLQPVPDAVGTPENREAPAQFDGVGDSATLTNAGSKAETFQDNQPEIKVESAPAEEPVIDRRRNRRHDDQKPQAEQDLPVTMVGAPDTAIAVNQGGSRWSAVAVALEGDEATLSLDQEMRKAYAAFVAEETASLENPSPTEEVAEESVAVAVAEVANPQPAPEPEPAISVTAAVTEPEPAIPSEITSVVSSASVDSCPPGATDVAPVEARVDADPVQLAQPSPDLPKPESVEPALAEQKLAEPALTEPELAQQAVPAQELAEEVSPALQSEAFSPAPQDLPPAPPVEAAIVDAAASSSAFAQSVPTQVAPVEELQTVECVEDSETVKSTAAAWASWRQIRDTGDAKPAEPSRQEFEMHVPDPEQSAAMAVAAGAEQVRHDAPAPHSENPSDVASIVDSVLADLRPRLMAEISRKMAEKK